MSHMIQYEIYCRRPRVVTLRIVGDFIGDNGGNFYTKKINCKGKSYCMRFFFFFFFCLVRQRCTACLRPDGGHTLYWNICDNWF